MGIRTVRLDADSESALNEVRKRTGLSVSEILRRGIRAYAASVEEVATTPYEVFEGLDLGPGGYALAPSERAKEAVVGIIREKHGR